MQYIWELIDLHTLVFKVGSKEYTHNGVKKTMDVEHQLLMEEVSHR